MENSGDDKETEPSSKSGKDNSDEKNLNDGQKDGPKSDDYNSVSSVSAPCLRD